MIQIGMRVRKVNGSISYYVKKLFTSFAEIEKLDKNYMESISGITEYVDLEKLEECVDEDTTGGCSGYS